jgi:argininosuccinate lyase
MSKQGGNAMWGGRFEKPSADIMLEINSSIAIDQRLYKQDIMGSKAHSEMLASVGILSAEDNRQIQEGLTQIEAEIENGTLQFKTELEDIHMNIESRLKEIIGEAAGRLHTARSRNDQVATDFRLWLREAVMQIGREIEALQQALQAQADANKNTIMPGFTHLQIAQPVTLRLHLMAYHAMLERDKKRFDNCLDLFNENPLGACALAGTGYNTNREMTAQALGFKAPVANTMDAVAARDFVLEFLAACSICASHLSRMAEEIVLWSTTQFGYITLSDDYTTGSSIMPQKKNPDAAELVRGKSGKITGRLMQMFMVMKALPLTYNKDMQDDKEATFDAFDTLSLCLKACSGMISGMKVHEGQMLADAENGYSTATDLADWLVTALKLPFREAHHVTGALVKMAENKRVKLSELKLEDMQSVESRITQDVLSHLTPQHSVKVRKI